MLVSVRGSSWSEPFLIGFWQEKSILRFTTGITLFCCSQWFTVNYVLRGSSHFLNIVGSGVDMLKTILLMWRLHHFAWIRKDVTANVAKPACSSVPGAKNVFVLPICSANNITAKITSSDWSLFVGYWFIRFVSFVSFLWLVGAWLVHWLWVGLCLMWRTTQEHVACATY